MRLNKIQAQFRDRILMNKMELENADEEYAHIFSEGGMPVIERLKIYRSNVIGNVGKSLIETFPLIEKLVGQAFLEDMVRRFILKNPPQGGCLTHYCNGFEIFIEEFKPAKSLPYLADMARLEIAINHAYHAKDDENLKAQTLTKIPTNELAELQLKLRDNVRLIKSEWPLSKIREFCLNDGQGTPPNLNPCKYEFLMIHRPDLEVQIMALSEDEYEFLSILNDNLLGESVTKTLNKHPAFNFASLLQRHISLKTLN